MKRVELLSPAGDTEALKAAVQNGADAVYLGANNFNARINGKNFNDEELLKAIEYAKLRNVKVHLTLNILIKNSEFNLAIELVKRVYKAGVDAIIVQDLGLARYIINNFPKLEVHASTQMTVYNLAGVKKLEELGFSRAVLARELSINEIKEICDNSNIEIETFAHGALCISYSGQCLMSSIIGGRSGNRGKCAGTCRLPYELINKTDSRIKEKGYLLSSKDVCSLDILPDLINSGVTSLKLEGRMKSAEYVGIVTSIYRKYIDLAQSNRKYVVEESDREKLMQVFNRGGFSTGYLAGKLGKSMMYTKKPNHIGIYLGDVLNYNSNKGHVKIKLQKDINLGDSICINDSSCKTSELMENKNNIKKARIGQTVTLGRIKGKIKTGDKVYKTVSLELLNEINQKSCKENVKREVNCEIILKKDKKLKLTVTDIITNESIIVEGEKVQEAENIGITKQRVMEQLSKTGNTVFTIKNINVIIDEHVSIPIKAINELRRIALEKLEERIKLTFKRDLNAINEIKFNTMLKHNKAIKVSVLLNKIEKYNPEDLEDVDRLYIPFSEFITNEGKVDEFIEKFNVYLYLPTVIKTNYEKLLKAQIDKIMKKQIKGVVISNISQIDIIKHYGKEIIANYTMNVMNSKTAEEFYKLGAKVVTISPEDNKLNINNLDTETEKEGIVYGRTLLMTSEYCTIGTFRNCEGTCKKGEYILKDRMGFEFPIYTDTFNCNNKIYNSKITSISYLNLNLDSIRIDILDEEPSQIRQIIEIHKQGKRLEGNLYTNGNINREI